MDQQIINCGFMPLDKTEMVFIDGGDWLDVFITIAGIAVGAAVGFAIGGPAGAAIGTKFGLSAANTAAVSTLIGTAAAAVTEPLTVTVINEASGRR